MLFKEVLNFYFIVIQGEDVKSELLSLLDELPEIYKEIAGAISNLKNTTHFYETFVNFLVPRFVLNCHNFKKYKQAGVFYIKNMANVVVQIFIWFKFFKTRFFPLLQNMIMNTRQSKININLV